MLKSWPAPAASLNPLLNPGSATRDPGLATPMARGLPGTVDAVGSRAGGAPSGLWPAGLDFWADLEVGVEDAKRVVSRHFCLAQRTYDHAFSHVEVLQN